MQGALVSVYFRRGILYIACKIKVKHYMVCKFVGARRCHLTPRIVSGIGRWFGTVYATMAGD